MSRAAGVWVLATDTGGTTMISRASALHLQARLVAPGTTERWQGKGIAPVERDGEKIGILFRHQEIHVLALGGQSLLPAIPTLGESINQQCRGRPAIQPGWLWGLRLAARPPPPTSVTGGRLPYRLWSNLWTARCCARTQAYATSETVSSEPDLL